MQLPLSVRALKRRVIKRREEAMENIPFAGLTLVFEQATSHSHSLFGMDA